MAPEAPISTWHPATSAAKVARCATMTPMAPAGEHRQRDLLATQPAFFGQRDQGARNRARGTARRRGAHDAHGGVHVHDGHRPRSGSCVRAAQR